MNAISLMTDGYVSGIAAIVRAAASIPLSAPEAQSILVQALELPLPDSMTSTYGIFQSDLIIRTALIAAIADMRANAYLLDYVFASLPKDPITFRQYGEQEVAQAKKWFLNHNIEVRMNVKGEPPSFPVITLALLDSTEAENTLGDVNPEGVSEDNSTLWPTIGGTFTPVYNAGTGVVTLPGEWQGKLILFPGMVIVDGIGRSHEILEVLSEGVFSIAPGTVADFTNAGVRGPRPAYVTSLESASFRETYSIGVHAMGEPVHCVYLHSIVVFALMRYRQALLEARGFERSSISSSDLRRNDQVDNSEDVFSRYMTLQGFVRNYWPKTIAPKIVGVDFAINNDPAALGDEDVLGGTP